MITKSASHKTGRMAAGAYAGRISMALILGASVALGATIAAPAAATELKMPSAKSKLLRDRDNVTIIIIDKDDDRRRSSSTSPGLVDTNSGLKQPSSKIRRDSDTVYIKRKSGGSHTGNRSGPKVIIVDKDRGASCSGSGVCVIRP